MIPRQRLDGVVTLSPFQVTADPDGGYRATNSLLGSRLNTPLRDLPGAISVFTKVALDDITRTRYVRRGFREDPRNASLTVRLDF